MKTIGTRELKQNPQSAIRRVLESGEDLELTAYGRPTGVRLSAVPQHQRSRWVSGAVLNLITPLPDEEAREFRRDVEELRGDDGLEDPFEGSGQ